jgi:hypothetical protein
MNLQTEIPVVGEKIKAGDPLFGPICIIEKIQRVDRIDTEGSDMKKWKLMPQDEDFDPKIAPSKDGYDEILMVPIVVNGDTKDVKQFYIVWCNNEEKNPTKDEVLAKIYGENEQDRHMAIVELDFWGSKYQEIADILNDIDFVRANDGTVIFSAMLLLSHKSKGLKGLVDIEKILKSMDEASENVGEDKDSFLKEFKKIRKELTLKYDAIG